MKHNRQGVFSFYIYIHSFIFKFIFNWKIIALQYWFDFCHTSAWFSQSDLSQREKNKSLNRMYMESRKMVLINRLQGSSGDPDIENSLYLFELGVFPGRCQVVGLQNDGNSFFSFLRTLYTVLHSGSTSLHSHQPCRRFLFSSHPQHLFIVVL